MVPIESSIDQPTRTPPPPPPKIRRATNQRPGDSEQIPPHIENGILRALRGSKSFSGTGPVGQKHRNATVTSEGAFIYY